MIGKNIYINIPGTHSSRPTRKSELKSIVTETIKERGPECDLNFIDTSLITDMKLLFSFSCFNGDISQWNTSNVTDMSYMFCGSIFEGDISSWDVSNVENMDFMFAHSYFNCDISNWNISKVKSMMSMFKDDSSFNQDVMMWELWKKNPKFHPDMFRGSGLWSDRDGFNGLFKNFYLDLYTNNIHAKEHIY